jgi:hypothetical protein
MPSHPDRVRENYKFEEDPTPDTQLVRDLRRLLEWIGTGPYTRGTPSNITPAIERLRVMVGL